MERGSGLIEKLKFQRSGKVNLSESGRGLYRSLRTRDLPPLSGLRGCAWGYSPNLLAWELWNESDLAEQPPTIDPVVDWHREMA
jgi:hypothetical protein